jgi:hypothetical protein
MANVAEVIDGDPTDIHPHPFFLERNEIFFFTSQGVVNAKCHKLVLKIPPDLPLLKGGVIPPLDKGGSRGI